MRLPAGETIPFDHNFEPARSSLFPCAICPLMMRRERKGVTSDTSAKELFATQWEYMRAFLSGLSRGVSKVESRTSPCCFLRSIFMCLMGGSNVHSAN